jgi:mitochondrial fission protein ELM1
MQLEILRMNNTSAIIGQQNLTKNPVTIWIMTEGVAGMEAQALGLSEAIQRQLGPDRVEIIRKKVKLRQPWGDLTPYLLRPALSVLTEDSDVLTAPWPNIIIGVGRQSVAPILAIRTAAAKEKKIHLVQLQSPALWSSRFDLVVPPVHDDFTRPNVITSMGACNRVTPQKIIDEAEKFRSMIAHLPSPRITVLVGGNSRAYQIGPREISDLADQLASLAQQGFGLMVTPSRRTGTDNVAILTSRLAGLPGLVWNGQGDNPYFGFLGLADTVIVTPDSVNMVSEAAATGKPVYIAPMAGGNAKFSRFHKAMEQAGITRPFTGQIEQWDYPPLFESDRIANEIITRFGF